MEPDLEALPAAVTPQIHQGLGGLGFYGQVLGLAVLGLEFWAEGGQGGPSLTQGLGFRVPEVPISLLITTHEAELNPKPYKPTGPQIQTGKPQKPPNP